MTPTYKKSPKKRLYELKKLVQDDIVDSDEEQDKTKKKPVRPKKKTSPTTKASHIPPTRGGKKTKPTNTKVDNMAEDKALMTNRRVTAIESISSTLAKRLSDREERALPAPSVHDSKPEEMDSEDNEEVIVWSKFAIKTLLKIDNKIVRDDVMDHFISLMRQAQRGLWPPVSSFSTPPSMIRHTRVVKSPSTFQHM